MDCFPMISNSIAFGGPREILGDGRLRISDLGYALCRNNLDELRGIQP